MYRAIFFLIIEIEDSWEEVCEKKNGNKRVP